ncbi:MAG: 30S ribosomal protein S5 [Parcubacteria group bacterium]|nr:30S ribosomal protein S5 [Parcubacteria group bacterium]
MDTNKEKEIKKETKFSGGKRLEKDAFDSKVLDLRRVARVVAGGRRFSFRATVVAGNRKGEVGVGIAKGLDVQQSVNKATRMAKKDLIRVSFRNGTIVHEVDGKFGSAFVRLKPAAKGRGIIAGGAVRTVLSLAGLSDVTSKIISTSSNKLNIARATLEALKHLKNKNRPTA